MDAMFFLSMACLSAVLTGVFYRFGRKDLVTGEKNEWGIRSTFCHVISVTVFFMLNLGLCIFADMELSGDTAGITIMGMLMVTDLIPLMYLKGIRYSPVLVKELRWGVASVVVVIVSAISFSFTRLSHLAVCVLDVFFISFNLVFSGIVLITQCRLSCRYGRENMSVHLLRTTAVIALLFLQGLIYTVCLLAGKCSRPVVMSGTVAAFFITVFHSMEVMLGYPLLARLEKKCRCYAREADSEEGGNNENRASETLAHRFIDYFESEKPYLSPDLCINEVAMYLMTNKTTLSRTLHNGLKCSFREYVNGCRVKEAIWVFTNNMHLDMEELARRSGFRNNTSFTNAFKLNVGKTPGAWCKEFKENRNEIWKKEVVEGLGKTGSQEEVVNHSDREVRRTDRIDK